MSSMLELAKRYSPALAVLGLVIFLVTEGPDQLSRQAWILIGIILLMITLWVTELVPFAVTALLPVLLFPVFGINTLANTCSAYANPIIFLFLGGFLMAIAMEKTNLHKRIALVILSKTGKGIGGILFGFMLATAVLSMWISNTATTVMMASIAIPALNWILPNISSKHHEDFSSFFLLSIAYSAAIGGVSTIIGTPPNAVLYGLLNTRYQMEISFLGWMTYGLPLAILMFLSTYYLYKRKLSKLGFHHTEGIDLRQSIQPELDCLGPMSRAERVVLGIFALAIAFWLLRSLVNRWVGYTLLDDASIAIFAGLLPFFVPKSLTDREFILNWADTKDLPWNILLLFGGGLALATSMGDSGLVKYFGEWLVDNVGHNPWLFFVFLPLAMLFLTELMGNVALASLFLPLTFQVAEDLQIPIMVYAYPVTIASSFAFMLPIATPPNAIIFSKGYFKIGFMIKRGVWLNMLGWILICAYSILYFWTKTLAQ